MLQSGGCAITGGSSGPDWMPGLLRSYAPSVYWMVTSGQALLHVPPCAMAKWLKRFHLMMMIVWACLAVPGILWWKESILFVIILSLYANFAGEFAAYQGARAEEKQDE